MQAQVDDGGGGSLPPVCGNGWIEAGEQCDGGICCTRDCRFRTSEFICDFETRTPCNGASADCGTTTLPAGVRYYSEARRVCP
ncbi:MAG: hypothetical protein V1798_00680 [Pseudomonadota bacterium]